MALDISKKTDANKTLRIISVLDDAIDWEKSYGGPGIDVDEKKKQYADSHDASKLEFFAGTGTTPPTVFVFKHPRRLDVFEKTQDILMSSAGMSGKKGSERALMIDIINATFYGLAEGLAGEVAPYAKDKRGFADDFFQGLIDAGVFQELGSVVLTEANARPATIEKK